MFILVDNHSTDNSVKVLTDFFHQELSESQVFDGKVSETFTYKKGGYVLFLNKQNRGFAAGNNVVLEHLRHWDCLVWLLNPDIEVAPNAMEKLVHAMEGNQNQLLGTRVFSMTNPEKLLHRGGFQINWNMGTVHAIKEPNQSPDYVYGGSLFTHSSSFKIVGLLPEHYFLYWEETHWCMDASRLGYSISLLQDAHVFDKVGGSIGRGYLAFYYYTFNSLRFFAHFRPQKLPLLIVLNFVRVLKKVLELKFQAARGIWNGNLDFIFNGKNI